MPIYEYQCSACQHELEILQKMTDSALVQCPQCGKDSLTKLISRSSFQLKGTGWYATDFKDSGKKPQKSQDEKPNVSTETNTSSKEKASTTTEAP